MNEWGLDFHSTYGNIFEWEEGDDDEAFALNR